jgi:hypothetical protein
MAVTGTGEFARRHQCDLHVGIRLDSAFVSIGAFRFTRGSVVSPLNSLPGRGLPVIAGVGERADGVAYIALRFGSRGERKKGEEQHNASCRSCIVWLTLMPGSRSANQTLNGA